MLKALPFLWFLLAGFGALAQLYAAGITGMDALGGATLFATASSVLIGTVSALGIALVYLLILRTRSSGSVAIIGYSHLFLASAATVAGIIATLARNRYLSGTGTSDYGAVGLAYTAAGLANLLSGIVFILALIVALNTRHYEPPEEVF